MELKKHLGPVVLGLNDALVELTGALAGLTFAFQNSQLIATAGGITGIAASLSMASSVYLSQKEEGLKSPVVAALYTGSAYLLTVFLLIFPYLVLDKPTQSLTLTFMIAVAIIFVFNFYTARVKKTPFFKKFLRMAAISLGAAVLNFLIGSFIRNYFRIDL